MYLDCKVKIPSEGGKITVKTISGTPYVYYETSRKYLKDKHYNTPKRTCIGKRDQEQPEFMYPNLPKKIIHMSYRTCSKARINIGFFWYFSLQNSV